MMNNNRNPQLKKSYSPLKIKQTYEINNIRMTCIIIPIFSFIIDNRKLIKNTKRIIIVISYEDCLLKLENIMTKLKNIDINKKKENKIPIVI